MWHDYGPNVITEQSVRSHNATINSQQAIIPGIFKVNGNLGCPGAAGEQGGKLMIAVWKKFWRNIIMDFWGSTFLTSGNDVDLEFSLFFTFPGQILSFQKRFFFTNTCLPEMLWFTKTIYFYFEPKHIEIHDYWLNMIMEQSVRSHNTNKQFSESNSSRYI